MVDPTSFAPIQPPPVLPEPQGAAMPSGGIILDQTSGAPAPIEPKPPDVPPAPPPIPMVYGLTPSPIAPAETVVVPPSGPSSTESVGPVPPAAGQAENPFIPQVVIPGATTAPSGGTSPAGGPPGPIGSGPAGGFFRKLLMFIVFILFLGGLVLAGKFALSFLASNAEGTITYWGLWENDASVRSVLTTFEAQHPKIKVTYVKQSPKQYRERLQAAIARGEGPDVFRFHNTWVPMLRNELTPVPTTVMTSAQFGAAFYPVASRDLVAGANIYGIPLMIDGLGLYYNEDLLASAGVTPPTTYEELLNIVPKLTVKNQNTIVSSAIALGTTGNVENFSDILATMMIQNGAKLTEPTGSEAEQTLIFYRKFADPSDPVYTWNDTLDNSIYAFASGKVAMIMAPSWRAFDVKQINPNLHFKIAPIPQLPGSTVTWASYWVEGVSAKSKNQKAAWEFVNYLTSREAAMKLYTEAAKTRLFGEPYARVELGDSLKGDPYVGAYIKEAGLDARSFPLASRTFDNGLNDKLIQYLVDAVNGMAGGAGPSAVLGTMASGFRQVLSTYGLSSASVPAAR